VSTVVEVEIAPMTALWSSVLGDYPRGLGWSVDGKVLWALDAAGVLSALHESGSVLSQRTAHSAPGLALAVHPRTAAHVVTTGEDGRARRWDVDGPTARAELDAGPGWVEHARWSPDGKHLLLARGRVVTVLEDTGARVYATPPLPGTVTALAWESRSARWAAGSFGGVEVWSAGREARNFVLPWRSAPLTLDWSSDGKVLAAGGQDSLVRFWRLPSREDSVMQGYPCKLSSVRFSPDARWLATAGGEAVLVWSFAGKGPEDTEPRSLVAHPARATVLAWSARDHRLASGARDGSVVVWAPRKDDQPRLAAQHEAEIVHLAWHPDGQRLAVSDAAGCVRTYRA
jgi:WD40 repeat protein